MCVFSSYTALTYCKKYPKTNILVYSKVSQKLITLDLEQQIAEWNSNETKRMPEDSHKPRLGQILFLLRFCSAIYGSKFEVIQFFGDLGMI